jgi:hypothetical protein
MRYFIYTRRTTRVIQNTNTGGREGPSVYLLSAVARIFIAVARVFIAPVRLVIVVLIAASSVVAVAGERAELILHVLQRLHSQLGALEHEFHLEDVGVEVTRQHVARPAKRRGIWARKASLPSADRGVDGVEFALKFRW